MLTGRKHKKFVIVLAMLLVFTSFNGIQFGNPSNFSLIDKVYAGAYTAEYDISSGNVAINSGGEYRITGSSTLYTVNIDTSDSVYITLDNVSIKAGAPISIAAGTTVNMTLVGTNTLEGVFKPGIWVPIGAVLNITEQSEGSLTAKGGQSCAGIGGFGSSALIKEVGTIIIRGGIINATGGRTAAGIGGGLENDGGTVIIYGGTVNAQGGVEEPLLDYGGAGIGGGSAGGGGTITIYGGTVNAIGGLWNSGIGGFFDKGGVVSIYGGTVNATSDSGHGICGESVSIYEGAVYASGAANRKDITGNSCFIAGGSVKADSIGVSVYNTTGSAALLVYPLELTLPDIAEVMPVTYSVASGSAISCSTDDQGKLYLWLPQNDSTAITATAEANAYDTDYKAAGAINAVAYSSPNMLTALEKVNLVIESIASPTYDGTSQDVFNATASKASGTDITSQVAISHDYYSGNTMDPSYILAGAPIDAGDYVVSASLSSSEYYGDDFTAGFTIEKAAPIVSVTPAAASIKSGAVLSTSSISGGSVTGINDTVLSGTFSWTDPTAAASSSGNYSVTFTPVDANYSSVAMMIPLTVTKTRSSGLSNTPGIEINDSPSPDPWENPFADIFEKDWYYTGVEFVSNRGLFKGTSEDRFNPGQSMSRGMFITVLFRLDGENPVNVLNRFSDVQPGKWYSNGILWASEKGIVSGIGNNKFGPDNTIDKEQLAVMLYNYAQYKKIAINSSGLLTRFSDEKDVQPWAKEAMTWAVTEGIFQGYNGMLAPNQIITRGQASTILERFVQNVLEKAS